MADNTTDVTISDKVQAYVNQVNANLVELAKRDIYLKELIDNLDASNEADLKALEEYVKAADASLGERLDALDTETTGRVSVLEGRVDVLDVSVNLLETYADDNDASIARLDASVNKLEDRADALEGRADNYDLSIGRLDASVNLLETYADDNDASIVRLDASVNTLEGRTDDLDSSVTALKERATNLENRGTVWDASINTLENLTTVSAVNYTDDKLTVTYNGSDEEEQLFDLSDLFETVSRVYTYSGTVANVDKLNEIENPTVGEVYNVEAADGSVEDGTYVAPGTNWAWNGKKWDALAGTIDLSAYAKSADVSTYVEKVKSDLQDSIDDINSSINTLKGDASTEGSVAYAVATAKSDLLDTIDALDSSVSAAINLLNGDEETEGSVANAVATAQNELQESIDEVRTFLGMDEDEESESKSIVEQIEDINTAIGTQATEDEESTGIYAIIDALEAKHDEEVEALTEQHNTDLSEINAQFEAASLTLDSLLAAANVTDTLKATEESEEGDE